MTLICSKNESGLAVAAALVACGLVLAPLPARCQTPASLGLPSVSPVAELAPPLPGPDIPVAGTGEPGASTTGASATGVQPAQYKKGKTQDDNEQLPRAIQLTPPSAEALFRMESERNFRERLKQEERSDPWASYMQLPEEKPQQPLPYRPLSAQPSTLWVEPNYVCSKRLFFEQPRTERYGESAGILQPFISSGVFYADVMALPFKLVAYPWNRFECFHDCYSPYFQSWPMPETPRLSLPRLEEHFHE